MRGDPRLVRAEYSHVRWQVARNSGRASGSAFRAVVIMMSHRIEQEAAGLAPAACRVLYLLWGGYSGVTLVFAIALTALSQRFGYDVDVAAMPILTLTGILVLAGAIFAMSVPSLVRRGESASIVQQRTLLLAIVAVGLLARIILFFGEPMLENDFQRYLWDGGVTTHGYSPYAISPLTVIQSGSTGVLGSLADEAGETLQRIGHKNLTTIYPPVAQIAFATAHLIEPWSLTAWRTVLLACDLATLGLLILLLDAAARSRLWVALYWLNPVALKEAFNSAHMEPILLPLALLSLYLTWRKHLVFGTVALALAAGVKLWPALLAPLFWRPLLGDWRRLAAAGFIFGTLMALWLTLMLMPGAAETSGLAAYAESWMTNSALYPALQSAVDSGLNRAGFVGVDAAFVTRGVIGFTLAGLALALARRPWNTLDQLLAQASAVVAALVLLSPAQYPWYTLWFAPFLVFTPSRAFLLLTATIPLYYTSFHFAARDVPEVFTNVVVWVIWAPVWLVAVLEIVKPQRQRVLMPQSTST